MPRYKPPPDSFSARARVAMETTTQMKVMEGTGIDRSDISGYLNGQKPDFVNLMRFCRAVDVSPTWLIFGQGERVLTRIKDDPVDPAQELKVAEAEKEATRYAERLASAANLKKFIAERKRRNKTAVAGSVSKSRTQGSK